MTTSRHALSLRGKVRTALLTLLVVLMASAALIAAELKTGTSADWLPGDAAFYSTHLRLKEVYDIAVNSKAWKKLKNIPTLQFGLSMASSQIQQTGILEQLQAMQLLEFGADLAGQEVFIYGDDSFIDFIGLAQAMNNANRFNALGAQLEKKNEGGKSNVRALLDQLAEDTDLIQAPSFLMGFKLKNTDLAGAQLDRLEQLLQSVLENQPEVKERLKRTTVDGNEYLTFSVDGGMIPEDELEKIKEFEETDGDYDEVIDAIKEATVTVSIGLRENYLLVSVGSDNELLESLGGDEVLSSQPAFKRLGPHLKKQLLSINYLSKEAAESLGMKPEDLGNMAEVGKQFLNLAELDEDAKQRIGGDIDELVEDLQKYVVVPGGIFSFEFLTASGTEGFSYSDSVNPAIDGSKPLSILSHVGESPILALAGRGKYKPDDYALLVKWLKRGRAYVEEFGLAQAPEDAQEKYRKFMTDTAPLWERLDKATGQMLIPSLKDGQTAFVLDAKIVSKQWHQEMPQSDRDLPMLEAALVLGVSDPALLRKAVAEYRAIINGFIDRVREENPEIPAEVKVPDPVKVASSTGNVYKYPLPAEAGVDELIAPSAGLSDKFAAVSTSPDQVKRILADKPLTGASLLAKQSGPAAGAVYFNWAGFVQTIAPWVDYAMVQHMGSGDRSNVEALLSQVNTGLEILQVLRSVESVITIEGNTTVGHTVSTWKDVD